MIFCLLLSNHIPHKNILAWTIHTKYLKDREGLIILDKVGRVHVTVSHWISSLVPLALGD